MAGLSTSERVVVLLEWGDIPEADAEIAGADDGPGDWQPVLWRGMRALMEGRFHACARLAAEAADRGVHAGEPRAKTLVTLLLVALRRDQERVAEAESLLRAALERVGGATAPASAHALLALLVGEMGRDGQARQELVRLLGAEDAAAAGRVAALALLAQLAAAVDAPEEALARLDRRLRPHASDFAFEESGAAFFGSVSYALGRLAQSRGRPAEAIGHYEHAVDAHARVGAPVPLAHAQRHLAALLRTSGDDGDWERAVALLRSATTIYRRLAIDGLAAQTQAVLARCQAGADRLLRAPVFRTQGDGWIVGALDEPVRVSDARGLRDIARLLAAPRKPVHVSDLLAPVDGQPLLDAGTRSEYEARLRDLSSEAIEADRAGDAVQKALARAERDTIAAALAGEDDGDPFERARRVVNTRIRISLDHIERAEPAVGGHLRASIRIGTFCSYEPAEFVRWEL